MLICCCGVLSPEEDVTACRRRVTKEGNRWKNRFKIVLAIVSELQSPVNNLLSTPVDYNPVGTRPTQVLDQPASQFCVWPESGLVWFNPEFILEFISRHHCAPLACPISTKLDTHQEVIFTILEIGKLWNWRRSHQKTDHFKIGKNSLFHITCKKSKKIMDSWLSSYRKLI